MTTLGLNYLNYKEQQRSNLIKEAETMRSNMANEERQKQALAETIRANQAGETIKWSQLSEDERSHKANEALTARHLSEEERSALVREAQNAQNLQLTADRNAETAKHNRADERIQASKLTLGEDELNALVSHYHAQESQARNELIQKTWNDFTKSLDSIGSNSSLPAVKAAMQIAATGAATTGVQTITGNSVFDQAIDTVKKEITSAISPAGDNEERAQMQETIDAIDDNVRSYASKTVGTLAEAIELLTNAVNKGDPVGNVSKEIGDVLDAWSKGLSDAVGGGKLGTVIADYMIDAIKNGIFGSDGSGSYVPKTGEPSDPPIKSEDIQRVLGIRSSDAKSLARERKYRELVEAYNL